MSKLRTRHGLLGHGSKDTLSLWELLVHSEPRLSGNLGCPSEKLASF